MTAIAESWRGSAARLWYRGHAEADWPLIPGIYREAEQLRRKEDALRRDFMVRGAVYLEGSAQAPRSHWDWYFIMQHYGLPTRLLDWSESALVALYFALRDRKDVDKPAAVWVLDPWHLNEQFWADPTTGRKARRVLDPEKDANDYLPERPYGDAAGLPAPPVAIRARHTSRRIAAQRGAFTLHGADGVPLDEYEQLRSRLLKIELPASSLAKIKRQLASAGVTEAVVFPELPGICREVVDHWRWSPERPA